MGQIKNNKLIFLLANQLPTSDSYTNHIPQFSFSTNKFPTKTHTHDRMHLYFFYYLYTTIYLSINDLFFRVKALTLSMEIGNLILNKLQSTNNIFFNILLIFTVLFIFK